MDLLESLAEITNSVQKLGDLKLLQKMQQLQRELVGELEKKSKAEALFVQLQQEWRETEPILATASYDCRKFGVLYGFIVKPWEPAQLEHILRRAMEYFLLKENWKKWCRRYP